MTKSLEDIQDEILDTLHSGEPIDREAVLEAHPEHAEALSGFFEVVNLMEALPEPEETVPARLGEFRIVREIGRGGMGVVYEAEQPSLKRSVALKVLPPALRADRGLHARFKREAEAAARLRHPNLVPVFSCGDSAGAPFFAMELVDGMSLADVTQQRRDGNLESWPETGEDSWRRALTICVKIADALQYAHGRGILHRDVKPANILLEVDGTPRLTDFGLALDLEASSLTVAGEVFGSPQYMSPEQAFRRESPLDARTDVYSLAVTLYELITLKLPYGSRTQTDILTALSTGELVLLREVDPELPIGLERVLSRALQHEPSARYADAAEFASDLRVVLDGDQIVDPACAEKRGIRKVGSWQFSTAVVAISLLIAAIYIGARYVLESGPNRAGPEQKDQLKQVASGESSRGEELLHEWIKPSVRMRGVLARDSISPCNLKVAYETPVVDSEFFVVTIWEMSIDGSPWSYLTQRGEVHGTPWPDQTPRTQLVRVAEHSGLSYSAHYDLRDLLDLSKYSRTVSVEFRLRARLLKLPSHLEEAVVISCEEADNLQGGTESTWSFPARSIFLYDQYPADYPELVVDPGLDVKMRLATIPEAALLQTVGDRELMVGLRYGPSQRQRPVNSAFEVDLFEVETGTLIGTGTFNTEAHIWPPQPNQVNSSMFVSPFVMPEEPSETEARFLLGAIAGKLTEVRLVFRPSRDLALRQPDYDSYWGGEIDVVVPFQVLESAK